MFARRPFGQGGSTAEKLDDTALSMAELSLPPRLKKVWEGREGDFQNQLDLIPEADASQLRSDKRPVLMRYERLRKEQQTFLAAINRQLPVAVVPWAMIPHSVWLQQNAEFLLDTCQLFPIMPWNMMLLPTDEESESALGLPRHLGGVPAGLDTAANLALGEIRQRHTASHKSIGQRLAKGETDCLEEYPAAKRAAIEQVSQLAQSLGALTYGDEAFLRHKQLFGQLLDWAIERP